MQLDEIERIFLRSAGESADAHQERWQHLNFGYRWLFGKIKVPEVYIPDATVNTTATEDWINVDNDLYSIGSIVNTTDGRKLDPERDGMRGRSRYIDAGTTKPPTGSPQYYIRQGNKIWLRDTPDAVYALLISFRFLPEWIDENTDLTQHPITPAQYDMAIVFRALGSFFTLHPPRRGDGTLDEGRKKELIQEARDLVGELVEPATEENLDRRQYVRQAGYSFNILGR
jgi:hypothetical protein